MAGRGKSGVYVRLVPLPRGSRGYIGEKENSASIKWQAGAKVASMYGSHHRPGGVGDTSGRKKTLHPLNGRQGQ